MNCGVEGGRVVRTTGDTRRGEAMGDERRGDTTNDDVTVTRGGVVGGARQCETTDGARWTDKGRGVEAMDGGGMGKMMGETTDEGCRRLCCNQGDVLARLRVEHPGAKHG